MSADFYSVAGAASANCTSRWLTEEVFKLIEMVQRDEAIYNPRHKYYFCRPYVENFWREVDLKLEKNPGASLAKWTNLRISFRREYTNYLEEKVPPCWSYFDRMFFLHPFLRKKHQQPKSLDSQVQDALVQINSLSNRLQRERAVAAAASVSASLSSANGREAIEGQQQQPLDNYLDYFDDADPEQNNSELDEIIEEERNLETQSLNNDIKSECEETVEEDYEPETIRHDDEADDADMRNFILDSLASSTSSASLQQHDRRHQRMQHLNRLQMRSYHEELRSAKRPRSQESIGSSQSATQRLLSTSTPAHSNVSFVRPTFAKPPLAMELVSTTTGSTTNPDAELVSSTPAAAMQPSTISVQPIALSHAQPRHLPHHHHHHRLEISSIGSSNSLTAAATTSSASQPTPSTNHVELCDCKTDPDAMFLMSLLPDIQKLNGRDRGKIKIAFQNILQDYLYPD